ncbi:MAG TPA: VOC family protein [Gemmatimonadaceae bacterium]
MHGRFTWYELYTNDTASAKKFYAAVTGWGVQKWDGADAENPYEMWTARGEPFAGMMALTDDMKARGVPPHWLAYVKVDSAADTIAKATSLGAQVVWGPETVPTVGVLAIFKDPQGAMIAILQPDSPGDGWDGKPALGKPSWHELLTTDHNAALKFYNAVFGWTKVSEDDVGGGMKYMTFSSHTGKQPVGGMFTATGPMANVPPNWLVYTHHRDAKGAVGAITRAGGKVINGPMEVPGGDWIVAFTDPQGATHALHTAGAKAEAPKPKKKAAKAKAKPKKSKKDKKKDKKKKKKR